MTSTTALLALYETIRSAIILDLENIAGASFDAPDCALTALVVSFPSVRLLLVDNTTPVTAYHVYEMV